MLSEAFWLGKRVFITGHTGFKGGWLGLWLHQLGAVVTGYALQPPTEPSFYQVCRMEQMIHSIDGDVRDLEKLRTAMTAAKPDMVIHMAAQPLVREAYRNPVETYTVNIMGTVNLLEAVRLCPSVRAVINVTTDKCYENKEWVWGYRENDRLGGHDPYSSSKACSELVTAAYRHAYFNIARYHEHGVAVASARAGNVIGGGDWAVDRLIPDCLAALQQKKKIILRNPMAVRPWQHVLSALSGYLLLAQHLYGDMNFAESWNFGPDHNDAKSVEWVVGKICELWGESAGYEVDKGRHPQEHQLLMLDVSKARSKLAWRLPWNVENSLGKIVEWTQCYMQKKDMQQISMQQIKEYQSSF